MSDDSVEGGKMLDKQTGDLSYGIFLYPYDNFRAEGVERSSVSS